MDYMRWISICTFLIFFSCDNIVKVNNGSKRWSKEQIWKWYSEQKWLVGTNFITSNSINQLEFWQEETFDVELIEKELKLSSSIGMNTHRVFLHDLLWDQDSIGFMDRIDHFLEMISNDSGEIQKSIDKNAIDQLQKFNWSGNVRELRNVIERLVILSEDLNISKKDVINFSNKS